MLTLRTLRGRAVSVLARMAVVLILAGCALLVAAGRLVRTVLWLGESESQEGGSRLLLTGTFYNVGWYRSHIVPLSKCAALSEIIVVCEEPLLELNRVTYSCPPTRLCRLIGRKAARLLWIPITAIRRSPDALMGYHIMPNALICLVIARWIGSRAIYQMTGGPVQIIGGGVGSENGLLRLQKRPGRLREKLMFHLVRQFDLVVVRGEQAVEFLNSRGLARHCESIPGSVDCDRFAPAASAKTYDLVTVGRLVAVKRLDRFLDILAEARKHKPDIRAAIVGDGPLKDALRDQIKCSGLSGNVDLLGRRMNVVPALQRARAFMLTSESEGLSIAMLEAMAAGLPPIVPDIGDLREVVTDGDTGLIIDPDRPGESAARLIQLLDDNAGLERMSLRARERAVACCGVESVQRRWVSVFTTEMGVRAAALAVP